MIQLNLAFGAASRFVLHILGISRCDIMLNVMASLLIPLVVNLLNKC